MSIRRLISRNLTNYTGFTTNRKIVVIESDDWGSIRMPSRQVYEKLLMKGIRLDQCPYNRFDSLASEQDLAALFDVLIKYQDINGNHPIITANTVVANPDFDKISVSKFKNYYYEPFTVTLKRYSCHANSFQLWKHGFDNNLFYPQFHGREHVNIPLWLKLLNDNNTVFKTAFEHQMFGVGPNIIKTGRINIQASYDTQEYSEISSQKEIIKDGLSVFENIFGFKSKSFIANNYIWDTSLNSVLKKQAVSILQGMKYQILPLLNASKRKMIKHFTGQINSLDQVFLVRNCVFEPSLYPKIDSVSLCMSDISNAFAWRKPAIITSHRLNFIGSLDESNRNNNLVQLERLLMLMLKKWPNVEFLNSVQLGELILQKKLDQNK